MKVDNDAKNILLAHILMDGQTWCGYRGTHLH